jgi:hypothetical protein
MHKYKLRLLFVIDIFYSGCYNANELLCQKISQIRLFKPVAFAAGSRSGRQPITTKVSRKGIGIPL